MGGRGSAGGVYGHLDAGTLERMHARETAKAHEARIFAHNTIHKNESPTIARKIRADTKKYDKAMDEIEKIERALKVARKRRGAQF